MVDEADVLRVTARCLDCKKQGILTARKATGKPLLCATHRRARRTKRRDYSHDRHIGEVYGLSTAEYNSIKAHQGGTCALCLRATGATRKLAVDHDHATGLIRGILCKPCNRNVLGQARDDVEFFERCIEYLKNPPAVQVIGKRITPDMAG